MTSDAVGLASEILTKLGFAQSESLEPGADVRRDDIAALIRRLEKERDEARTEVAELHATVAHLHKGRNEARAEIEALTAKLEKARAALKPMADALSKCLPGWEDHVWVDDNHSINMGHLRAAARAVSEG